MPRRRRSLSFRAASVLAGAVALAATASAQPRAPLPVTVKSFRVAGAPLPEAQLVRVISDALGKRLAPQELEQLADRLSDYCDARGFHRLRAVLPSQDFRQGVVRFEVVPVTADPAAALLERARLWEGRARHDFAREELAKLFRIAPNHVDGIAELALIDARANQSDAALRGLVRLRQAAPRHPYIPRIATLLRINGADRGKLRQARLLARSGRRGSALVAYRNLFAGGQPDGEVALEYWQLVAAAPGGYAEARSGFARLVQENPGNPRYRLALAQHESGRDPLNKTALATIIELSKDPETGREAKSAWRGAVMRAPQGTRSIALLRDYLAEDPKDAGVRERLTTLVRAEEEHRRLLANPYYQARLAGLALLDEGRIDAAEERLAFSLTGRPQDGEAVGGLGLVHLRQGRHREAQREFERALALDPDNARRWRSLAQTAQFWGLLREARDARDGAQLELAAEKVNAARRIDPREPEAWVLLGDLRLAQGRSAEAKQAYEEALRFDPQNRGALRGLVALAQGDETVAELSPQQRALLRQDGGDADAREARRLREEADGLMAEGRLDAAIDALQRSLAAEQRARLGDGRLSQVRRVASLEGGSGTLAVEPAPNPPPPLDSSYQYKRLAGLLDRRTTWLSSALDWHTRSGTPGVSQLDMIELPVEWRTPWREGEQLWLRADAAQVDAGTVAATTDDFGTNALCAPTCAADRQRAEGLGLAAGYEGLGIKADIGTTPLGFPVSNVVGGVRRKGDLGDFGYSVELSRRPLTGSLLSFAGARDPRTGETWGGVVASGARLGLSRDEGGGFGFWSSLGLHRLTGRNVQDNDRLQLMAGGYWRLINDDDRLFSVGLTGMYWRFKEDAGEYTFGHGGYYSPELYESISLPVTWARRYARFSYQLRASVSASWSKTAAAPWFPTDAALQSAAGNPQFGAGSGTGTGYAVSAAGEYQWSPRLFLGGRLELERSDFYAPNRVLLYLRYAADHAAAQPVALSPDPVIPTSQF